jgi:SAM-dependent methyltransferase
MPDVLAGPRRSGRNLGLQLLRRTRLLPTVFRAWERRQARRSVAPASATADGLPLPPPELIVLVSGRTSAKTFLRKGRAGADLVRNGLARQGVEIGGLRDVLDFGVGCGRVARHWHGLAGPRIHGCDVQPELVAWTDANLPFVDARLTGLEPPLPYGDGAFDAIYAFSVFTHLPEDLGLAWARELRRVLRPGGHLLISTHGEGYVEELSKSEASDYAAGRFVVRLAEFPGGNLCNAFHPPAYVRDRLAAAAGLTVAEHVPRGARSNGRQDFWVLAAGGV